MVGWCCKSCRESCSSKCNITQFMDYGDIKIYTEEEVDFWIQFFVLLNFLNIVLFILVPMCLYFNKHGIKNKSKSKEENGINFWYKSAIGICLFLWFINITGTSCNLIIWNYTNLEYDEILTFIVPLDLIRAFAWILGKSIMFALYIIRLHLAFKESLYRYTLWYLSILGIFLILHTICGLYWFYSLIIETSKDYKDTIRASNHITLGVQMLLAEEIFLSFTLIMSFVRPLFKIVSTMNEANMDHVLLECMAKCINLGIISVVSSSVATIMNVVYSNDTDLVIGLFTAWIQTIDCVINAWCIVLLLKSTHNIYLKLCVCTHRLCMKFATKTVHRKITGNESMTKLKVFTNYQPKSSETTTKRYDTLMMVELGSLDTTGKNSRGLGLMNVRSHSSLSPKNNSAKRSRSIDSDGSRIQTSIHSSSGKNTTNREIISTE